MSKDYSPLKAIRRATSAMNKYVRDAKDVMGRPINAPDLTLSVNPKAAPCVVLLRSLTDGGPVPDDFTEIRSGEAIKNHKRSDGAVFKGAFELQNTKDSLCLVYGDESMTRAEAERAATLERPALMARHHNWTLGPFGAPVPPRTVA